MPRNGNDSQVKWYDINPCYVFHPMNSYEDGDKIVLDVVSFRPHVARQLNGLPTAIPVALRDQHNNGCRHRGTKSMIDPANSRA